MTLNEAITARHSVRSFTDRKIDDSIAAELQKTIDDCNRLSGFRIQLMLDEPNAFSTRMAHYGNFHNCKNYIAMIGGHHIVAIVKAKVCDIWDSTDGCIGNYWTKE